jgi:hypothetical protein
MNTKETNFKKEKKKIMSSQKSNSLHTSKNHKRNLRELGEAKLHQCIQPTTQEV